MNEVTVTALRFNPTIRESPAFVTLIGNERLQRGTSVSLAGVVAEVPGIHIKDYGGASGLKTISQRGLGAEHTLVLLNGMRMSSFQNGLVDLGLFPLGDMEQIEVLHGGQSAVHGSDAVGGVINMITTSQEAPLSAGFESAFGSFGYQRIRASGGARMGDIGIRANLAGEKGKEDYPFLFRNGPTVQEVIRTNSDFTSRYGTIEFLAEPGDRSRFLSFARAYQSDRGVGGAVLSPTSSGSARQRDEDYVLQASLRTDIDDLSSLNIGGQVHSAYQRYQDPEFSTGQIAGLDTYFKNNDYRSSASLLLPFTEDYEITAGGEVALTTAGGTSMAGQVERWHGGSFIAGKLVFLKQSRLFQEIILYPSIRVDGFTGTSPAWSPQAALLTRFTRLAESLSLEPYVRVSASRNFRMPTFNELYYQGGGGFGNPALRPETARSVEVGGGVSAMALGRHLLDFSYFETRMTDRIVWVAAGSFGVTPENIRDVLSRGFEVSWLWNFLSDAGSLRLGYGNISSRKTSAESDDDPNINTNLVYVPEETANASLDWKISVGSDWIQALQGEVAYHFVGSRYTSEDNKNELPAYQLLDVSLAATWGVEAFALSTKLDMLNILNEDYQVILGYPMPMRSFRVTFTMRY